MIHHLVPLALAVVVAVVVAEWVVDIQLAAVVDNSVLHIAIYHISYPCTQKQQKKDIGQTGFTGGGACCCAGC